MTGVLTDSDEILCDRFLLATVPHTQKRLLFNNYKIIKINLKALLEWKI